MTLTFISNYINHHQIPFCNACYEVLGEDFCFIQTQPMEQERIDMGWDAEAKKLPYVRCLYEEEGACKERVSNCDVLLAGWTDREDLIGQRLKSGKITVRVSERLYREGQWKAVSPRGLIRKYLDHTRYRNGEAYLLCAGAYVPSDFHIVRAYPGKMFRFGYFPETVFYTPEQWQSLKPESGCLNLVWAGRFIPLKHPEQMIALGKELLRRKELFDKEATNPFDDFRIHMVGSGEMEEQLKAMAQEAGLQEKITFYGFMEPSEVRKIMEKSHIHVFTSNHLEGWGAVVNEAMNSGCAEVANVQVGAAPYLITHGENGLVYPDANQEEMIRQVIYLVENPKVRKEMGRCAYETITGLWNAKHAAEEFIRFAEGLQKGKCVPAKEGPLSPAPVIAPRKMYAHMLKTGKKG